MKKAISLLLLLCMVLCLGTGYAQTDEKINLTLWITSTTVEREAYVDSVLEAFMKEYPNVTVEATYLTDSGESKALTAYSAQKGPDLMRSNITTEYISNGYLLPLDDYFAAWDYAGNLNANSIAYARTYDVTGNENLYYLPIGYNPTVLWVRSDWVKEAGGSIDTWEHLFEAIEKMTDKENGRYGLAIRGGSGGAQFLERMMYSYSGITTVFDDGVCTINAPKNVEFVERYLGMYNKCTAEGDLGYGWTELSAAFDSGAAGVIIHNLGSAQSHVEAFDGDLSKFEAIIMPANEEGISINNLKQESGFMIAKTCEHPEWAFKLATYMAQGEIVSELCRLWGTIPIDLNVLASAEWLHAYPWNETAVGMMTNDNVVFYDSYSYLPGVKGIYSEMDTLQQYVMTGEMSAQEFLDEWARLLQQDYDAFFAK